MKERELTPFLRHMIEVGARFDQALAGPVQMGLVTLEDAAENSSNGHHFVLTLRQAQLA